MLKVSREIKRAGKIVLPPTVVVLGAVWTYLEKVLPINTKPELSTIYLVQLGVSAVTIIVALSIVIVLFIIWRSEETRKDTIGRQPDKEKKTKQIEDLGDQFDSSILMHILKLRGLNQVASAKNIAVQMNQDAGLILTHLNKLHNDQFVTFQTGGRPPTLDTDFFLTHMALGFTSIGDTHDNLYSAYGVFWDTKFNMHCLSCTKPLKNSTLGPSVFFCSDPKCNSKHILKDDLGNEITRQEAINRIRTSS